MRKSPVLCTGDFLCQFDGIISKKLYFKRFVILKSTPAILISSWHCFRNTYFCFQGDDSEVNLAKIIQAEVTFAKRKLNLLFTFAEKQQNKINEFAEKQQNKIDDFAEIQ